MMLKEKIETTAIPRTENEVYYAVMFWAVENSDYDAIACEDKGEFGRFEVYGVRDGYIKIGSPDLITFGGKCRMEVFYPDMIYQVFNSNSKIKVEGEGDTLRIIALT